MFAQCRKTAYNEGNGFHYLQEDKKKEAENAGEEMLCAIIYMENSDKGRFSNF